MKFVFKFLLTNGHVAHYTFTACDFRTAHTNALNYARVAFDSDEIYEIEWVP